MSLGEEKAYETQMYTEVATYKGNPVALRRFNKHEVRLDRVDLLELKLVSSV